MICWGAVDELRRETDLSAELRGVLTYTDTTFKRWARPPLVHGFRARRASRPASDGPRPLLPFGPVSGALMARPPRRKRRSPRLHPAGTVRASGGSSDTRANHAASRPCPGRQGSAAKRKSR